MKNLHKVVNSKWISAIISAVFTVIGLFMCVSADLGLCKVLSPILLLFISLLLSHSLYPLLGAITCLITVLATDKVEVPSLISSQTLKVVIGIILLATSNYVVYLSDSGCAAARLMAQKTKTRRVLLSGILLSSAFLSSVPEAVASSGKIYSDICRRMGVSTEKLTLIVTCAAMVFGNMFGFSMGSTEIAQQIRIGLDEIGGQGLDATQFAISSIQYNFFAISMAIILIMSTGQLRDMGGILSSELRTRRAFEPKSLKDWNSDKHLMIMGAISSIAPNALFFITIFVHFVSNAFVESNISIGLINALISVAQKTAWGNIILISGFVSLLGGTISSSYVRHKNHKSTVKMQRVTYENIKQFANRALLILAAALVAIATSRVEMYVHLVRVINVNISSAFLPVLCFIIAFTIGIISGSYSVAYVCVLPTAISVSWKVLPDPALYYTTACGAVLSGAAAGALCAPHSFVNVLGSLSCGCDHGRHMTTQIPYVLLSACICNAFGFFPLSIGFSTTFGLFLVLIASYAAYDTLSKCPDRLISKPKTT